jgi:HPt (histidine-containing phosphotransfer) domain-containing protein
MDELSGAMSAIWARNLVAQERRVAVQEQAVVALLAGTLDAAGREQAAQAAHKLAGSLGSFGLPDGTSLASQLEAAWSAESISSSDAPRLAQLIAELRRELREFVPTKPEPAARAADAEARRRSLMTAPRRTRCTPSTSC